MTLASLWLAAACSCSGPPTASPAYGPFECPRTVARGTSCVVAACRVSCLVGRQDSLSVWITLVDHDGRTVDEANADGWCRAPPGELVPSTFNSAEVDAYGRAVAVRCTADYMK